jgi:class 3 adenylate cyclase/RecA/RadA recombinase
MRAGGGVHDPGQQAGDLISRAQAAVAGARWLEALDLASQALAADPGQTEAAILVGTARQRLGTVSAAGAELRQVTVVAADMASSTAIAARIGPERMRELMLETYELCVEAVTRYEGRVIKYGGDGVLAQFGHPVAHEDDPRRAVLAATAIIEAVEARAGRWESSLGETILIRVGVDSGLAAVGPMEATPWSPEDIAGDPPNVATRVQSTAEPMTVRVTDATQREIAGWFETEPVGLVELRNYPRPVGLHRVLRRTEAETRLEADLRPRPSLVDRSAELAVLRTAWNQVAETGERRVVSIFGEPGIGKSRLVEHMVATAVAAGASHVTIACSALYRDSPLRPVSRALARFFRVFPHEGGNGQLWLEAIRRRLEQLPGRSLSAEDAAPIYAWLLGIRSAVDLQPDELRLRSFAALEDLLEAMANSSILVLGVEDADAADPSTAALLQALLARPHAPMLVILSSRHPLSWLEDTAGVLELTGLEATDTAALVSSIDDELSDDVVRQIVERADGVPFFAEELTRAAQEGQEVVETAQLSGFLRARVDELGADAKQLMNEIAIAGQEIRLDVLRRVSELPDRRVDELLAELDGRRVIVRAGGPISEVVRFRHGLMRNVAYEGLLGSRRAELHARLAAVMSELPEGAVVAEDLAAQLERAGDHGGAAPRWLQAGYGAAEGGAYVEAIELYRRGLAALAKLPDSPERAPLELQGQLGLGAAVSSVEGYTAPAARAAFERARALADGLEDTPALLTALWGVWTYWFVLGEHAVAMPFAERWVRIGEGTLEEGTFRLSASATLGYAKLYHGDFAAARNELVVAGRLRDAEPLPEIPHDPAGVSLAASAVALWFTGDAAASREAAREAAELAESLDPAGRRTALTRSWIGCMLAWRAELDGEHEAAMELASVAAANAQERGHAVWLANAIMHRSIAQISLGQLDEGLPVLTAMLEAWRSAGRDPSGRQLHPVLMTPYFAGRLAEALLAQGDVDQAATIVDRTLAETAANGEHFWDVELLRLRAAIAAAHDASSEQGQEHLEAAHRLAETQGARALQVRIALSNAPRTEARE